MKTKTLFASLAVASFALSQPVAAATRSYESVPAQGVQSAAPADRAGSIAGETEALKGSPLILILLVFGVLAALLAVSSGSGNNTGSSPG